MAATLSIRARRLVELLADLSDDRPIRDKVKDCGFSERHGYRVARRPDVLAAVHTRALALIGGDLPEIYRAMIGKARRGDVGAARLILQAVGDLDAGINVTTNVMQMADADESLAQRLEAHHRARFAELAEHEGAGLPADSLRDRLARRGNGSKNGDGA